MLIETAGAEEAEEEKAKRDHPVGKGAVGS